MNVVGRMHVYIFLHIKNMGNAATSTSESNLTIVQDSYVINPTIQTSFAKIVELNPTIQTRFAKIVESNPQCFKFMRILQPNDTQIFTKYLIKYMHENPANNIEYVGYLLVNEWDKIMRSCENEFIFRYNVFRYKFWGENSGISPRGSCRKITHYHSLIRSYYNRDNPQKFAINFLADGTEVVEIKKYWTGRNTDRTVGFLWTAVVA